MYRVIMTEPVKMDIRNAAKYIAEELQNPSAAQRLLQNAESAALSLSEMPLRHGLVKNELLELQGIRSLPVDNYLLFYTVREKEKRVVVQRFLHSTSEWSKQLPEGNLDA